MATITAAVLRNRVLDKLRISKAGEDPSAEDAAIVDAAYPGIYEELSERNMVAFVQDAIDTEYVEALRTIVASRIADDFFVPEQRLQRLLAEGLQAEGKLRELVSKFRPQDYKYVAY